MAGGRLRARVKKPRAERAPKKDYRAAPLCRFGSKGALLFLKNQIRIAPLQNEAALLRNTAAMGKISGWVRGSMGTMCDTSVRTAVYACCTGYWYTEAVSVLSSKYSSSSGNTSVPMVTTRPEAPASRTAAHMASVSRADTA